MGHMGWDDLKSSRQDTRFRRGGYEQADREHAGTDPTYSDRPSGTPAFYASLPAKQVAAACLFRDDVGRVLLVKPVYKDPWELPGGGVDENESPLAACARELQEELGIDLVPGRLLCVDYRAAVDGIRGDALRFVFDGGMLTSAHCDQFVLDPKELLQWSFVDRADLDTLVTPAMARRIRAALVAEASPVYLEEGYPPSLWS